MKRFSVLIVCALLAAAASAYACTDPSPKKVVRASDNAVIVYEYFSPAKLAENKKASRPIAELADSLLNHARSTYNKEALANQAATSDQRIYAEVKATPKEYQEHAQYELFRIRSWADSICNSFRRGSYKIGPEDAPR